MFNKPPNNDSSKSAENNFKIAAHDLNNLLNNILNGVELLKDKLKNENSVETLINHIETNTLLASEIIQQLNSTKSSIESVKVAIDIQQIITETVELLGKDFKSLIHIDGLNKNILVWGNYTNIKRVLLNLLINAEEANPEHGFIRIKIDADNSDNSQESFAQISISDSGPGIESRIINNIFEEGFSTKSNNSDRGLGLSIVKEIINDHMGHIEVNSDKNIGTTFDIYLPIFSKNELSTKLENKKIVIAEDDEFQREVLKDLLKSLKLNVFTASNGIEALELYTSQKPDLLFIDDQMPGMTGLECSDKINDIDDTSRIVLVTGSNIEKDLTDSSILKILKKPYSFEMIESTIKELL